MRNLGLSGAEIVVVPQAGAVGEWTEGLFEAELRVAAFQNGYFAALVNRVGRERFLHFSGGSFVVDPDGGMMAQAPPDEDHILLTDLDRKRIKECTARRFFLKDRRPEVYAEFKLMK
jgi:N-carbamoylputrescine amidase